MRRDEMHRLVVGASVARLATIDPDGRPHLVPIVYALDGDRLYTAIDHKPKRTQRLRRLDNIARDDRVTVLVDHYEPDWTRLWWVRLDGRARLAETAEEIERASDLLTQRYRQYEEHPIGGPIIAIDIERWSGWRATPTR